jgi:hypothetical protein
MQITEDVGKVVNKIIRCRGVSKNFDHSLVSALSPVQRVDYVVGLVEDQIDSGRADKKLMKHYQKLKKKAPSYFAEDNGGWNSCHLPIYGGN